MQGAQLWCHMPRRKSKILQGATKSRHNQKIHKIKINIKKNWFGQLSHWNWSLIWFGRGKILRVWRHKKWLLVPIGTFYIKARFPKPLQSQRSVSSGYSEETWNNFLGSQTWRRVLLTACGTLWKLWNKSNYGRRGNCALQQDEGTM